MDKVALKTRKAYLAMVPWVTILKKPRSCTGWTAKSQGKRPCMNVARYSFKHHKGRSTGWPICFHEGEREYYCWAHLLSRGLYGDMCEENRIERWMKKNPPPWRRTVR